MRRVNGVTIAGVRKVVDLRRPLPVTFLNTFVSVGTSIAAGVGVGGTQYAYPTFLASRLGTAQSTTWTPFYGGVSGDTTTAMLARLPALLSANRPQWVTMEVSVNDTRIDIPVISSAQTLTNIQAMLALCTAAGAKPIIVGSAPWDQAAVAASGNNAYNSASPAKAITTNGVVSSWAAANGVKFVDLFAALGTSTTNLVDGLHPNVTWQDKWAQAIAAVLLA